jgi:hypothetical protein
MRPLQRAEDDGHWLSNSDIVSDGEADQENVGQDETEHQAPSPNDSEDEDNHPDFILGTSDMNDGISLSSTQFEIIRDYPVSGYVANNIFCS